MKHEPCNIDIEGKVYDYCFDDEGKRIQLGGGGGGNVFLATNAGREYAIKEYKGFDNEADERYIRSFVELEFLCSPEFSSRLC